MHDIEHETCVAAELYKASENDMITLCQGWPIGECVPRLHSLFVPKRLNWCSYLSDSQLPSLNLCTRRSRGIRWNAQSGNEKVSKLFCSTAQSLVRRANLSFMV